MQRANRQLYSHSLICPTRSNAALRAADQDWIIGLGYTSGWYILGCWQRLASCLWQTARIGPDLLCHPSSVFCPPLSILRRPSSVVHPPSSVLRRQSSAVRHPAYVIRHLSSVTQGGSNWLELIIFVTHEGSNWLELMIFRHSRGVPTDWKWWFFVTDGGS